MKLRNKKTGEIFDALVREKGGGGSYSLIVCDIKAYEQSKSTLDQTHFVLDEYETLAELNEEWEDAPAEPLIKDEKIRKAVKAWAEANDVRKVDYWNSDYKFQDMQSGASINFEDNPIETESRYGNDEYTIDELCGEGEAPEPLEPTFVDLDERIKEKGEE